MKVTLATKSSKAVNILRKWHLVDAKGKILGRLAPQISKLLQGKHKSTYASYLDSGDNVVVVNAKDIVVTGRKADQKRYTHYSGYPGGLKIYKYAELLKTNPTKIIENAVSGMLPKNKFRSDRLRRLFIYKDNNHSYNEKFGS
ncbi:MAG: 50S ribosomal protein L13 [Candidatus Roizmanbacteria bacterium GW2011_GWA2_35_19]|uniref:Large ribosomal subunit protein uL13 n=2 Tax=Candidatus Roizmaniibacteriota TaxID=1752723 RepID=A0A0G0EXX6_9BACT|nr:MAG: 50S ribosomal protein L13 [Candidatus Roizmanbacteria bacterium GW2011_GWC2_35_12]KKP72042.1 MAG: 50S ribosomal protein L13 [Candidatus Roizmanbacteria bacterium GW2011_GWA2_35_19]